MHLTLVEIDAFVDEGLPHHIVGGVVIRRRVAPLYNCISAVVAGSALGGVTNYNGMMRHGINYVDWTCDVWNSWDSLITDYNGTPNAGFYNGVQAYGGAYHDYLAGLP